MIRKAIVFLLLMLLLTRPCDAWSQAGHRVIASIAFRQLTANQQKEFVRIISKHPRFTDDFEHPLKKATPELNEHETNEWMIQQASLWPDIARGYNGGLKSEFHRGPWHYINQPVFLLPADEETLKGKLTLNLELIPPDQLSEKNNVIQVIRKAREIIPDRTVNPGDRAVMLAWLCHTVGDIHQPLHSVALFSEGDLSKGDRGGNEIKTTQHGNLHSLWDTLPGEDIKWNTARNRALKLLVDIDSSGPRFDDLNEETWLNESVSIASSNVYDGEIRRQASLSVGKTRTPIKLSKDYLTSSGEIAKERLAVAGVRLGKVLKLIFEPK